MFEDLVAPTAATANVFAMTALAARENWVVKTVDIGGDRRQHAVGQG